MKTEIYSWRVSREKKSRLERAARKRKTHVAAVLDLAVDEWLARNATEVSDDEEQKRLHAIAERFIGVISGKNPRRAANSAQLVRKSLRRKYGR